VRGDGRNDGRLQASVMYGGAEAADGEWQLV
jgi:hypothetical protein